MKLNNRTFSSQQPFCSHISSTVFGSVSRNKTCKKKNIFLYNLVNNVILEEHSRKKSTLLDCISQLKKDVGYLFSFLSSKKKSFFSQPRRKKKHVVSARLELATFCGFKIIL